MYTQDKPDLEYLAHYGVKGTKWGTRKGEMYDNAFKEYSDDKVGR